MLCRAGQPHVLSLPASGVQCQWQTAAAAGAQQPPAAQTLVYQQQVPLQYVSSSPQDGGGSGGGPICTMRLLSGSASEPTHLQPAEQQQQVCFVPMAPDYAQQQQQLFGGTGGTGGTVFLVGAQPGGQHGPGGQAPMQAQPMQATILQLPQGGALQYAQVGCSYQHVQGACSTMMQQGALTYVIAPQAFAAGMQQQPHHQQQQQQQARGGDGSPDGSCMGATTPHASSNGSCSTVHAFHQASGGGASCSSNLGRPAARGSGRPHQHQAPQRPQRQQQQPSGGAAQHKWGIDPRLIVGTPVEVAWEVLRLVPAVRPLLDLQRDKACLRNLRVQENTSASSEAAAATGGQHGSQRPLPAATAAISARASAAGEVEAMSELDTPLDPEQLVQEQGLVLCCRRLPARVRDDLIRGARSAVTRTDAATGTEVPGTGLLPFFWRLLTNLKWLLRQPATLKGQLLPGQIDFIADSQRAQSFQKTVVQRACLAELAVLLHEMLQVPPHEADVWAAAAAAAGLTLGD